MEVAIELEVMSDLEKESALRLLSFGYGIDETVLLILKRRNYDLVAAMWRDMKVIIQKEQKRKLKLGERDLVWDPLKLYNEKILRVDEKI